MPGLGHYMSAHNNDRRISTSERFPVGEFKTLMKMQTMDYNENEKIQTRKMFDLPESSEGGMTSEH